jgi:glutamine amidotransferase
VANVANIARALRTCGAGYSPLELSRDPAIIARATKIVLPGVGSFAAAMSWLRDTRIDAALTEAVVNGAWLLGICVGHQLLFDSSDEMGTTRGLGLVHGDVRKYAGALPVPQIGWNKLRLDVGRASARPPGEKQAEARPALFDGIEDGTAFYFVNSYAARNVASEVATADYDGPFTAAVQQGRVFGVQFHPEKSSAAGLRVLRNFAACN